MPGTRRQTHHTMRSPLWAKIMVTIGAVVTLVAAGGFAYAKNLLNTVNSAVGQDDFIDNDADPGSDLEGPLNLLLLGSDKRDDWTTQHSDTIMILHVSKNLDSATITSIPRDLYVPIQDCGELYDSPCETKITEAIATGGDDTKAGIQNLVTTLNDLTGIDLDGVVLINFAGFADLVNTLGSVELCLPFDMPIRYLDGEVKPKGCNEYDPDEALAIVRERYAYYPDQNPAYEEGWGLGDYGRQHMQQHFIKQLLAKAEADGYASDVFKIGDLIESIGGQFVVDIGNREPAEFAFDLRHVKPTEMETATVPSEPQNIDNTSYVVTQPGEQQDAADALWKALRDDDMDQWIADNPDWVNQD